MSELDPFEELAAVLEPRSFDALAGAALAGAELEAAAAIATNVRRRASRHRRTGALERGITVKSSGKGAAQTVTVDAGSRVARFVAGGTEPHTIRALGRSLPIAPTGGAAVGFARSVRHPGTKPDPFVAAGVADSSSAIAEALEHAGTTITTAIARATEG